jgi:hypothetical protein
MRQGSNPRRPRSRGNGKRHPGGGGQSRNSTFESSGPDGKVRGTAQQVYDKYLALARDALSAGDRMAAENYSQHADHYYRIIQANREEGGGQPNFQGQPNQEGGDQGGFEGNPQQGNNGGNQGQQQQQHGRDGRDFRHHNNNQNQNYNRNQRGVPVAELRDMEDDDRQPDGLDNASNDPARTTTH